MQGPLEFDETRCLTDHNPTVILKMGGELAGSPAEQLLNHPDEILAGVDLSDAERAQLRGLTAESLDSLAIDL